jgi:CheY-like chemotaxis protein
MDVRAKEKRISLEFRLEGPVPTLIETDAVRLRQILLNLLGNAIKFTENGSVQLVVRHLAETKQIQFDIVDTGIGINDKDLETLFEPFTQADTSATRSHGGTGLGLTISRRLARVLGGDISVTSELHRGSTFSLTIDCHPVTETEPVSTSLIVQSTHAVDETQPQLNGCVLVVDDRRDIRFIAQHFIECAGGRVILASNGQEAVDMLKDADKFSMIDLILMDMQMPVMDGYEATMRLRALGYSRPIIALTAHAMKSDRDKCSEAGCTDYTTKPLQRTGLLRMLFEHLERSRVDRGSVESSFAPRTTRDFATKSQPDA